MGYDKTHIPILSSQEGYTRLAKEYKQFHKRLNARDRGRFERFLPRSLTGLRVLDIGGGDGRLAKHFGDKGLSEYRILDSAPALVARAPRWTQHTFLDLNEPWALGETYDVLLCFFVVVHIDRLAPFFEQIVEHLAPGGRCILLHHLERDGYLHTVDGVSFRITTRFHSFNQLEVAAKAAGLSWDVVPYAPHGDPGTQLYCFYRP